MWFPFLCGCWFRIPLSADLSTLFLIPPKCYKSGIWLSTLTCHHLWPLTTSLPCDLLDQPLKSFIFGTFCPGMLGYSCFSHKLKTWLRCFCSSLTVQDVWAGLPQLISYLKPQLLLQLICNSSARSCAGVSHLLVNHQMDTMRFLCSPLSLGLLLPLSQFPILQSNPIKYWWMSDHRSCCGLTILFYIKLCRFLSLWFLVKSSILQTYLKTTIFNWWLCIALIK